MKTEHIITNRLSKTSNFSNLIIKMPVTHFLTIFFVLPTEDTCNVPLLSWNLKKNVILRCWQKVCVLKSFAIIPPPPPPPPPVSDHRKMSLLVSLLHTQVLYVHHPGG